MAKPRDDFPLSAYGKQIVDSLENANTLVTLLMFERAFLSDAPLLEIVFYGDFGMEVLGHVFKDYANDKQSRSALKSEPINATDADLSELRALIKQANTPKQTIKQFGAFLLRYPRASLNGLVMWIVAHEYERLADNYKDAKDQIDGFRSLPAELFECLGHAFECAHVSRLISMLCWSYAIRGQEVRNSPSFEGLIKRLKTETGSLRGHLNLIGHEIAAALDAPAEFRGKSHPSAVHAVFALGTGILELIALGSNSASGLLVSLPTDPIIGPDPKFPDMAGIWRTISAIPDPLPLLPQIQKELSRVSLCRNSGQLKTLPEARPPQSAIPTDPITLREMAALGMIGNSTVANWGTDGRPSPRISQRGKQAAVFSYDELRVWFIQQRPDIASNWPEKYRDARTTLAKMSKK